MVCARANSASREPLTGSICVAGSTLQAVAPLQPAGAGFAQFGLARGGRVGWPGRVGCCDRLDMRFLQEIGRGVFGLAHAQADRS